MVSARADQPIAEVTISCNEMWLGDPATVRQPDPRSPALLGSGGAFPGQRGCPRATWCMCSTALNGGSVQGYRSSAAS